MNTFDFTLAFHCAPTLARLKPASLFSIRREQWTAVREGLARSGRVFVGRQVYFRKLPHCSQRILLLVYQRDLLGSCLARPENCRILQWYGYASEAAVSAMLDHLARRLAESYDFPHEIGVFLGYPPEDVWGFIEHNGRNYSLCGCWKVYGDPVEATRIFSAYERARCFYCARVLGGEEIQNIQYGGVA